MIPGCMVVGRRIGEGWGVTKLDTDGGEEGEKGVQGGIRISKLVSGNFDNQSSLLSPYLGKRDDIKYFNYLIIKNLRINKSFL